MNSTAGVGASNSEPYERYFGGDALYGDDLSQTEIDAWYRDEAEGFSSLDFVDAKSPVYHFHALNRRYGFRYLPAEKRIQAALGIGSAFAEEFEPIADRIESLVVLDPSGQFPRERVHGIATRYVKPQPSGLMEFADSSFDCITCFGTLHHIPNVSLVLKEIARVLRPDGYALIREPIVSMGDWRKPRAGLTRHERGIPYSVFEKMIRVTELEVVSRQLVNFGPFAKLSRIGNVELYNSNALTALDGLMCSLLSFNKIYHRRTFLQKIGPTGLAWVLRKPDSRLR